jgi:hypothetical protein
MASVEICALPGEEELAGDLTGSLTPFLDIEKILTQLLRQTNL